MQRTLIFLPFLFLLTVCNSFSQPLLAQWTRHYGTPSYFEHGESVVQADDGSFVIAGYSRMFGSEDLDMVIFNVDENGHYLWNYTFDFNLADVCRDIVKEDDGYYLLCGSSETAEIDSQDLCVAKIDREGNQQWVRYIGGDQNDFAYAIDKTSDGGYIASGGTHSFGNGMCDYYLVKLDSEGNETWHSAFGLGASDVGRTGFQTTDGGYLIAGYSDFSGVGLECYRAYLVKTDSSGQFEWDADFEGEGFCQCFSAVRADDGGYVIAGITGPEQFEAHDVYVVKTDESGNMVWENTYGGEGNEIAYAIEKTSDGGYILTGSSDSFGLGGIDLYVIKIDDAGNLEWENIYGDIFADCGYDILQTNDGGYFLCGEGWYLSPALADFYTVKIGTEIQPEITLNLFPLNPPIVIPASGGNVDFEIELTNSGPQPCQVQVWLAIDIPYGIEGEPFGDPVTVNLAPGQTVQRNMSQYIRANLPDGEYIFYAIAGNYRDDPWVIDSFNFIKSEGHAFSAAGTVGDEDESGTPFSVYPNPFNSSTAVSFTLQDPAAVRLAVYDVLGRQVSVLADGHFEAGLHRIGWPAEGLAGGIYFIEMQIDNQVKMTGKVLFTK